MGGPTVRGIVARALHPSLRLSQFDPQRAQLRTFGDAQRVHMAAVLHRTRLEIADATFDDSPSADESAICTDGLMGRVSEECEAPTDFAADRPFLVL
jgi:hypothetical protein